MKRIFSVMIASLFLFLSCLTPVFAEEEPVSVRTIRVGLIDPPGMQNGYAYQMALNFSIGYLNEISKQRHWQYLYSRGSYQSMRARLLQGDLDIIVPVQPGPSTARGMSFSGGIPVWTLLHLYQRGDAPHRPLKAEAVKGCVIGYIDNNTNKMALEYYIRQNGWQVELRSFPNADELQAALRSGELDMVCDDGSSVGPEEHHLTAFTAVPGRFMTTPDKGEMLDKLTQSMLTIERLNPGFGTSLREATVNRALQAIVAPTLAGQQFVEDAQPLRVVFLENIQPFYEINGPSLVNASGLYIDYLKLLANISGLRFTPVQAQSVEEIWEMLTSGEADLALGSYVNGATDMSMYYTSDLRSEAFSVVRRRDSGAKPSAINAAAIPEGFPGAERFFSQKYHQRVRTLDSVEECLDEVMEGNYEIAYIPSLYLQSQNSLLLRSELEEVNRETTYIPIALVISPKQPHILQDVLNTAILRMDENEKERLEQKNSDPVITMGYLWVRYPLRTVVGISLAVAVLAIACFSVYRGRMHRKQNAILQQKNEALKEALRRVELMRESRDGYKLESETDRLTSVYNKAGFEQVVEAALEVMPEGRKGAFYIVDMDHFKEANDTYGHQCGDEILQKFAKSLKEVFRQNDCVGRFGGDEFVVFMSGDLTREAVEHKALQTLEAIRKIVVDNHDIKITASVGIAMYPENGKTYDELFKVADHALYQVKEGGRNGYSVASEGVQR